jgi:hypothetical protein
LDYVKKKGVYGFVFEENKVEGGGTGQLLQFFGSLTCQFLIIHH